MEFIKYELQKASRVLKEKALIEQGCTLRGNDIFNEIIDTYDNLVNAQAALEEYSCTVDTRNDGTYEVEEYYVEENLYEIIDEEKYYKETLNTHFAKGDYHTERKWLGDFGDYDLIKSDNDIEIEFHENVNRKNLTKYLTDAEINWLLDLVDEFDDAEDMDESETVLFTINDLLGI